MKAFSRLKIIRSAIDILFWITLHMKRVRNYVRKNIVIKLFKIFMFISLWAQWSLAFRSYVNYSENDEDKSQQVLHFMMPLWVQLFLDFIFPQLDIVDIIYSQSYWFISLKFLRELRCCLPRSSTNSTIRVRLKWCWLFIKLSIRLWNKSNRTLLSQGSLFECSYARLET